MELKRKVVSGFGWMAGGKFVGQIFAWSVTLIVIRLLSPGDYGLMALATLVLTFLNLAAELGLSSAIVQRKNITDDIVKKCFGLILISNIILFVSLFLTSSYISGFFNEPKLTPVIQLISVSFLITAFGIVPEALLEREMQFKKLAIINLVTTLIGAAVTLVLALFDHGIWALVWGNVSQFFFKMLGVNFACHKFILPSFKLVGMKNIISYSYMVAMERLFFFFFNQSDSFIIGKIFGKELLGIYSVASHLASLPMQKISGVINQVAFPAFSSIQSDKKAVSTYILKASRLLCFSTFPIFLGISSISPEFVNVILGEKWLDAIIPLQLLTLVMPFRMHSNILSPVLRGIGRPGIALGNNFISFIIMASAFYIGTGWGIIGVCYAWVMVYPFVFLIATYRTMRTLNISYLVFLGTIIKPFLAGAGMYLAIYLTRTILPDELNPILLLASLIIVGAMTYVIIILTIADGLRKEALGLLKR